MNTNLVPRKNLFSNRRGYWQKIRAPIQSEDEICRQINANEVFESDKYLLGRACVRNNYMQAYYLLKLLPEVNIIMEAREYNGTLFEEVFEWYDIGQTYINTDKGIKPVWNDHYNRFYKKDFNISITKLYRLNNLPNFVWGGMDVLICYICYHGIDVACDKWLKYDIGFYTR